MIRYLRCFILSLSLSLGLPSASWGQPGEAEELLGPLLLPETTDWLAISGLPRLSEERLAELAPQLKQALRTVIAKPDYKGPHCSDVLEERLFERDCCFYSVDVNNDGREDVLYSNHYPCAEGGLNIIWYNEGQGTYSIRGDRFDYAYVLRLKPDPAGPLIAGFEPGCCADFVDVYTQERPGPEPKLLASTFKPPLHGFDPKQSLLKKKITFKEWVEIREEPEQKDEYDPGYSAGLGYVFVGNILTIVSSYGDQPCRGTLLGYDESGGWGLVVLDAGCEKNQRFSVSWGDFIRVGWARAEAFELEP